MQTEKVTPEFIGAASIKSAKAVILGCPYEEPRAFRKGTAVSSQAIRNESRHLASYHRYRNQDLHTVCFADGGDIKTENRSQKEIFADIEEAAEAVLSENKKLFAIGGSGAINYPLIKAVKKVYPEAKILSLDAHTGKESFQDEITHDNILTALFQNGILKPYEWYYWGQTAGSKSAVADKNKQVEPYLPPSVKKGVLGEMHRLYRYPIFVALDIDIMDPPFAPGSGHPVYGGIETTELFQTLDLLKSLKVVGMSLTEVVPAYDSSGITTVLAATVIKECLSTFLIKS